jgi:hypothetical protein
MNTKIESLVEDTIKLFLDQRKLMKKAMEKDWIKGIKIFEATVHNPLQSRILIDDLFN